MKGSEAILEMLSKYKVEHVFGLIGETTFPLYKAWDTEERIKHVFGRDERNLAIMAEAYARVTNRPGILEVPGVGASYTLPGITEAYVSGTPVIELASDIPSDGEKKNILTEYDKELMFKGVTKETFSVDHSSDIPRFLRRAFRVSTTAQTGPVFMKFPSDSYEGEVDPKEIYAQPQFSRFPSIRQACDKSLLAEALNLIMKCTRPVIICGQGVIFSEAFDELQKLSHLLSIPVGTTISGKGSFPENDPLSIGVVGSRGGTEFSRKVVDSADLVFFIGTNTDSASTSGWKTPVYGGKTTIIHLDVNERNLGNNYNANIMLLGDAKLILGEILAMIPSGKSTRPSYAGEISDLQKNWNSRVQELISMESPINPIQFVKVLEKHLDLIPAIAADPGVGAIYTSTFMKSNRAGRKFLFNYSIGGLGFALPASIGAYFGLGSGATCLTTDGSLYFNEGELETIAREGIGNKIFVFNNGSFGWIRATMLSEYGRVLKGTDFHKVSYENIAKAYGLDYFIIEGHSDVEETIGRVYSDDSPALIEVPALSEDSLLPPVPEWEHASKGGAPRYMG